MQSNPIERKLLEDIFSVLTTIKFLLACYTTIRPLVKFGNQKFFLKFCIEVKVLAGYFFSTRPKYFFEIKGGSDLHFAIRVAIDYTT